MLEWLLIAKRAQSLLTPDQEGEIKLSRNLWFIFEQVGEILLRGF